MTSTTETLQLEHLCGYLPYGLKMQIDWPNGNVEGGLLKSIGLHPGTGGEDLLTIFVEIEKDNSRQFIFRKNQKKYAVKPLVIPLSELTLELLNNEMPEQLIRICKTNQKHILTYGYQTICILMKYHFDVFGLLEKGLAVNKLTTV